MNAERPTGGKPCILVVDDDTDVREGLARALSRGGSFDVATAADGFEAGYRFARHQPDLVLLDVVMPGMGGFEICERMRAMAGARRLRIVILTGFAVPGNNERSLLSGADLFLTKPQDVQSLLTHIEDLLQD
jgi:two-component system, cell cycle response regulator